MIMMIIIIIRTFRAPLVGAPSLQAYIPLSGLIDTSILPNEAK